MSAEIGLLDTSVIVAQENHRPMDTVSLPDRQVISVITLGELRAGVLAARDTDTRARRIASLTSYSDVSALGIDEPVAEQWARLRLRLAETGRRLNVNDLWIAAIALANDLPVVTQDRDFAVLSDLGGPDLIMV